MKSRVLQSIAICLIVLALLLASCTTAITEEEGELPAVANQRIIQEGNDFPITQIQPKLSQELEDNRIGICFADLWNLEPEAFPEGVLDAQHILKIGVTRARFAINHQDADRVH